MKSIARSELEILNDVFSAIDREDIGAARTIVSAEDPFTPALGSKKRYYSKLERMRVHLRDGFIDVYTGKQLVCPGALRLASKLMPEELPFQDNWNRDECHHWYWNRVPTIDHLQPISRGGADRFDNWVSTTMTNNAGKRDHTIEELGWKLVKPDESSRWDGHTRWFLRQMDRRPDLANDDYLKAWASAARRAMATINELPALEGKRPLVTVIPVTAG